MDPMSKRPKITAARIAPGMTIAFGRTDYGDGTPERPHGAYLASGWTNANMVTVDVASIDRAEAAGYSLGVVLVRGTDGLHYSLQTSQRVEVLG
jgi:hypothetical protein